jgi:hypothetical protein
MAMGIAASGQNATHLKQHTFKPSFGHIPLAFEANQGQTSSKVKYLAHGAGYSLFITDNEAVFSLGRTAAGKKQADVLRMQLANANSAPGVDAENRLPGQVNYLLGNNPSKWHTHVPTFGKVRFSNVYPGVDLVYYGNNSSLEYDFVVKPGAQPSQIALALKGASKLTVMHDGGLAMTMPGGQMKWLKPVAYQMVNGHQQAVAGRYHLLGKDRVGFQVAKYDASRPLVIDPALLYSTYIGGGQDDIANGVAVDSTGAVTVVGSTLSSAFPTSSTGYDVSYNGDSTSPSGTPVTGDAFVTKIAAGGGSVVYSTYLGGTGDDSAAGVALDASGLAVVTGFTASANFPVSASAAQKAIGSLRGAYHSNAFVTRLSADGSSLVQSTYVGGYGTDFGSAIAIDASGNVYIAGSTNSRTFPVTSGAYDTVFQTSGETNAAFVSELNSTLSTIKASTYLGVTGTSYGYGIAVDSSGVTVVGGTNSTTKTFPTTTSALQATNGGGYDAFVTKFNTGLTGLVSSTLLGGAGNDYAYAVATDSTGTYVAGSTASANFPTSPTAPQRSDAGGLDAFVAKITPNAQTLTYSTFLGGAGSDAAYGITVDGTGVATVVGATASTNFPTTTNAYQTANAGGTDAFAARLSADGSTWYYSTYFGGSAADQANAVALGPTGAAFIAGYSRSSNLPTTTGAIQTANAGGADAFVAELSLHNDLMLVAGLPGSGGVVNGLPGTPVTLSGTATFNGNPVSGENLSFIVGSTVVGNATTNASGQASITYNVPSNATPGPGTYTVGFAGDEVYNATSVTAVLNLALGTTLTVPNVTATIGDAANPVMSATLKDVNGKAVANETVVLTVNGTQYSRTTNSSGTALASYNLTGATPGTLTISASFAGDTASGYTSSTGSGTLTINQATTTLTNNQESGTVLGQVTFSGTLTYPNAGTATAIPNATISFSVGGTSIGTATTNSKGSYSFTYTVPDNPGANGSPFQTQATYAGSTLYTSATGNSTLTVAKAQPTISVSSVTGKQTATVTLSANIGVGATNLVSKTLTFLVNGSSVGTGTTNSTGTATLSYLIPSGTAPGSYPIEVTFAGDNGYLSADSATTSSNGTLTVSQLNLTNVNIDVSDVSAMPGQKVGITATVTDTNDNPVTGKSVSLKVGATTLTATTDSDGIAFFQLGVSSALAVGANVITCSTTQDTTYAAQTGTGTLTLSPAPVQLVVPTVRGLHGTTVHIAAYLDRTTDGSVLPNRKVTFTINGTTVSGTTASTGKVTVSYSIPSTALGAITINASYTPATGDPYQSGTGTGTLTVN